MNEKMLATTIIDPSIVNQNPTNWINLLLKDNPKNVISVMKWGFFNNIIPSPVQSIVTRIMNIESIISVDCYLNASLFYCCLLGYKRTFQI